MLLDWTRPTCVGVVTSFAIVVVHKLDYVLPFDRVYRPWRTLLPGSSSPQPSQLRWLNFIWSACLDPTMTDLDGLTHEQKTALAQLEAITNGADLDTQVSLLESVNWDVQVGVRHCCFDSTLLTLSISKQYSLFIMRNLRLDRHELSQWSSTTRSRRPYLGEAPCTHVSRGDQQTSGSVSSQ
jgi:hypothetical protein